MPHAVPAGSRLHSLDTLRGFALLGILLMNIQSFSMPEAAYLNPTAYGDFTGINRLVWALSHLLADNKFMSIFAMLFGAGIVLFTERLEARGEDSFRLHYRRMFWLLVFGLIHAHFIWYGDILYHYAICGMLLYFARHWPAPRLMALGLMLLFIGWALTAISQFSISQMTAEMLTELKLAWAPPETHIAREIADYTGSWQRQFARRSESAFTMETLVLLYMIWRLLGLMLIGMALYKQGQFSGSLSSQQLLRNAVLCIAAGFALTGYGMAYNLTHQFAMMYAYTAGTLFNYVGSVITSLGYLYLLGGLANKSLLRNSGHRLAQVGRMAFSNYIGQSLICTFIFYGFGLGLFGAVERWQQLLIVIAVWVLQLAGSGWWLARFRYGPLEWLWRVLTYGRRP
ncbi:DUF418 domain-containing protein [Reinekea marinisedimentorum]|uniref:DUF418 domain-containing protein n=1 Tax=Reinekea marinisedimentorum TaxID=230495 RepID=A0A4V2UK70_9GAMM|nr:DUF418 domain-containing protein [Reinekea marinisedimentorum]TCS43172.1 uncharacterized protein BCF53_102198 [Reinekea marinisedimentorum]